MPSDPNVPEKQKTHCGPVRGATAQSAQVSLTPWSAWDAGVSAHVQTGTHTACPADTVCMVAGYCYIRHALHLLPE